jgi:hypothetical protein
LSDETVRTVYCEGASKFIGKGQLLRLKLKAVRAGVWFRSLPRIDRVLVDLTIKVAQNIRSPFLASSILSVARKLEGLLENKFARAIREVGFPLACKLSTLAKEWGNRNAWSWAGDEAFARYLAVMKLNG